MQARAQRSGGNLTINSAPGSGTEVVATFQVKTDRWRQFPGEVMSLARILLADDHELFREGLAGLIDAQPDLEVVGHGRRWLWKPSPWPVIWVQI